MTLQVIGQYYLVPFGCKVMKHLTLIVFESGSTQFLWYIFIRIGGGKMYLLGLISLTHF